MDLVKLQQSLEAEGFSYRYFETAKAAADYLDSSLDQKTVGMGGSMTIKDMGLYDRLSKHNEVFWAWKTPGEETMQKAGQAQVYLTSVNALAETGELINIDGNGNRIAASLYGREKVCFIVGVNKVDPSYEDALFRARNVAAPLNARRLQRKTPCATKDELKCYNCKSPERICRGLSVLWRNMNGVGESEVILIGENLGY